ncbi:hypothetical protein EPUL_005050 [Erysiphe pulchra]|uniref:Uncharacterized protein n=1 Tax=Erysiphe pulchra TaxID=225359 RepID=A0A2S4PP53_9PEZI|nr:hypothetical protein EPUL_005050 [Erysiphe pulchra]
MDDENAVESKTWRELRRQGLARSKKYKNPTTIKKDILATRKIFPKIHTIVSTLAVQVLTLSYWQNPELEKLVQSKIGSLCKSIHFHDTLRLVDEELEDELERDLVGCREDQEEWLENFLMASLNAALENNSVDRADCVDLSIFKSLRHTRLTKFFATKLFESYISRIPIKNEKDGQKPKVESQETKSVSTMALTTDTSPSDEF